MSWNLTVNGKINNIPVSTIAYISNLTSDIQEQINTKSNITDVSTLQTLVNTKANIISPTFTWTVNGITKTMVGLSNVDNTSDLLKPISTLTLTALGLKSPLASPTFTGTVSGITKTMVALANVDNTSDILNQFQLQLKLLLT